MATYVLSKNRKKIRRKTIMSNPIVTITMENGDVMKAELYPEIAPNILAATPEWERTPAPMTEIFATFSS